MSKHRYPDKAAPFRPYPRAEASRGMELCGYSGMLIQKIIDTGHIPGLQNLEHGNNRASFKRTSHETRTVHDKPCPPQDPKTERIAKYTNSSRPEICTVCDRRVPYLMKHANVRHLPWFVYPPSACALCSIQCNDRRHLGFHWSSEHPNEEFVLIKPHVWRANMSDLMNALAQRIGIRLEELPKYIAKNGLANRNEAKIHKLEIPYYNNPDFKLLPPFNPSNPQNLRDCSHWRIVLRLISLTKGEVGKELVRSSYVADGYIFYPPIGPRNWKTMIQNKQSTPHGDAGKKQNHVLSQLDVPNFEDDKFDPVAFADEIKGAIRRGEIKVDMLPPGIKESVQELLDSSKIHSEMTASKRRLGEDGQAKMHSGNHDERETPMDKRKAFDTDGMPRHALEKPYDFSYSSEREHPPEKVVDQDFQSNDLKEYKRRLDSLPTFDREYMRRPNSEQAYHEERRLHEQSLKSRDSNAASYSSAGSESTRTQKYNPSIPQESWRSKNERSGGSNIETNRSDLTRDDRMTGADNRYHSVARYDDKPFGRTSYDDRYGTSNVERSNDDLQRYGRSSTVSSDPDLRYRDKHPDTSWYGASSTTTSYEQRYESSTKRHHEDSPRDYQSSSQHKLRQEPQDLPRYNASAAYEERYASPSISYRDSSNDYQSSSSFQSQNRLQKERQDLPRYDAPRASAVYEERYDSSSMSYGDSRKDYVSSRSFQIQNNLPPMPPPPPTLSPHARSPPSPPPTNERRQRAAGDGEDVDSVQIGEQLKTLSQSMKVLTDVVKQLSQK